ncbi:cation-binding protein [Vibrio diabolicus]|uniref:Cation-binding protein n=6 Tax=Gammaproteobacteria TaxID=1236 RepID=A0AAX1XHW2_9VIBR|nr:cation-binding protein [Vibrio diabolicus]EGQ9040632.1 cation-binding protein [Vibrio parahaemolyticus]MDU9593877.1 cation-binding protein [Vibrio sp. 2-1-2a]MDU9602817.1 cation-binding protein [Vibrio sp. 1-2-3a]NKJ68138.1 cation-binding protein [Vibrio chemaguriensis]NNN57439.1 cation-binding protein [Vibrio sp. 1-2 (7-a)]NNN78974.1 cation-binding protein [Vibrio sp. 11-4(1)]PWF74002.1 cation-binding protein [Vibrio sp. T9]
MLRRDAMMIERIRREHGYMVRLLAILRHKLNEIKEERAINYALVSEIVDYLSNHSEKVHHPKEDILYHHFLEHYGKQQTMENLEKEHQELASKTKEFASLIEMILQDAVVPQDMFVAHLEDFIESQRRHLELEERKILPLIEELFTTEDWQHVESLWSVSEDDPVFGDTIADRYKQLAERVRQSDAEYV